MGTTLIRGGALFVLEADGPDLGHRVAALALRCAYLIPLGVVNYKDWEFFRSHDPRKASKTGE